MSIAQGGDTGQRSLTINFDASMLSMALLPPDLVKCSSFYFRLWGFRSSRLSRSSRYRTLITLLNV